MTEIAGQFEVFTQYIAIFIPLLCVVGLSVWGIKSRYPIAFLLCFGVSEVLGFQWYNIFETPIGLAIGLGLIVYSFCMAGAAFYTMFAAPKESEE